MATVETATVTLTVNGREVTVPKGRSLVEAAAEAGIEIPVFCYEPRLGAGVGACRMCLCEIEGMPKLQTACTTPAADGMVVDSKSARALEGQDAVLEFLLLNHPLDCPVCDKGGECPLQDLTFRYGPPVTRMRIPKRTQQKPVPISPLIALDRERCILCYRCTRFSESVSGDMQLVAESRGANSIITTFEGRPYANEFSGNVTELCPVGALTSAPYRFRARPWEIQNIPTVCGLCPVGCNTAASIREGHVVRVLSRNHPEVDEGWLCDKGRYGFGLLRSPERITQNLIRGGRGLEPVTTADVLDHVADRLRATVDRFGPGSVAVLASGEQTNEEAHAWVRLLDEALGGGITVCGPESGESWEILAPYAASIAELGDAEAIVVAGDTDVAHRAPVVELRIRKAAQAGARVVTVGAGGTRLDAVRGAVHVPAAPGTAHVELLRAADGEGELAAAVGDAPTVLVWAGPMRPPVAAVLTHLAHSRGWTVLRTPRAPNELGCRAAGLGTSTADDALAAAEEGEIRAVVLLGADPVGDWHHGERWRAALGRAFFVLQATAVQNDSTGWATTVVPASTALEEDGTMTNLEGRVQRLRAAATAPPGIAGGYAIAAELAGRLGVTLPYDPPSAFADLAARRPAFQEMSWSEIGERAELGERPAAPAEAPAAAHAAPAEPVAGTVVVGYRQLMSGPAVDTSPELHFQRRAGVEISHADAESLGIAAGDRVRVSYDGGSHEGAAIVLRRLRPGVVRVATRTPYVGPGAVEPAPEGGDA
ncbi:MAG TPA: 2Fe-2S iron-sulfur cluster-binding protein [Gaiellales bacterium]|nr:2Fe-2S iron-sulfur cluster-binding protein [Gaiellales bacterium]